MHILIVEDERALCDTIARSLRRLAYSVDCCYDGQSAAEMLAVERFDLVVLDLNLPGEDGMTVLRTLRERDRDTKVLILSARCEVADKVAGLDAGANDYLTKPFREEEIDRALDWCLEHLPEPMRVLSVYSEGETQELSLASIRYLEVFGHRTHIHTLQKIVVVRRGLDDLETAIDSPDFLRCHRSFLVNMNHVMGLEGSNFRMSDKALVPISIAHQQRVRSVFIDWTYRKAWEIR